jgi:hypothetical protein
VILLSLAKRFWWVLPIWAVIEYLVAPVIIAVLAPIVWNDLWPRFLVVMEQLGHP